MAKQINVSAKAGIIFSVYIIARKPKQTYVDKQDSRNSPAAKKRYRGEKTHISRNEWGPWDYRTQMLTDLCWYSLQIMHELKMWVKSYGTCITPMIFY